MTCASPPLSTSSGHQSTGAAHQASRARAAAIATLSCRPGANVIVCGGAAAHPTSISPMINGDTRTLTSRTSRRSTARAQPSPSAESSWPTLSSDSGALCTTSWRCSTCTILRTMHGGTWLPCHHDQREDRKTHSAYEPQRLGEQPEAVADVEALRVGAALGWQDNAHADQSTHFPYGVAHFGHHTRTEHA